MILIPALETVLLLPPRTGSGSLRRAVMRRHPDSMLLYRHMEADGLPAPYTRWRKVGVVREPVGRLWSLYRFCRGMAARGGETLDRFPDYAALMTETTRMPFGEWITDNRTLFSAPFVTGKPGYFPVYAQLHALPETRKSQWLTLRPDLSTRVVPFDRLDAFAAELGIGDLGRFNANPPAPPPPLSPEAEAHVERFFAWDRAAARGDVWAGPAGTCGDAGRGVAA